MARTKGSKNKPKNGGQAATVQTKQRKPRKKFRGTVAELIEQGLTVNGKRVDQPAMSMLTRYGIGRAVDKAAPRSETGRGKTATIWEFGGSTSIHFGLDPHAANAVGEEEETGAATNGNGNGHAAPVSNANEVQEVLAEIAKSQEHINALLAKIGSDPRSQPQSASG